MISVQLDCLFYILVFLLVLFLFAGMLMGIAIRTGSPLSLNIAEPVWKQLAGMPLTISDLTEVDKDFVPGMIVFCF